MQRMKIVDSPVGALTLVDEDGALAAIRFGAAEEAGQHSKVLECAARQLEEYFSGERRAFSMPLLIRGTPFQRRVWQALMEIGYGETATYEEVAVRIGNPKACRAVGMANNRNPLPIVIPCHRVVGKGGELVGYAGGLDVKAWLLNLEKQGT